MEFTLEMFVPFIAYLGIVLGYLFILKAPEERQPGMRYFLFLQQMIFPLLVFLALWLAFSELLLLISVIALFLYTYRYQQYVAYGYYAVAWLFLSTPVSITAVSSALFIYGLCAGATFTKKDKKQFLVLLISPVLAILFSLLL